MPDLQAQDTGCSLHVCNSDFPDCDSGGSVVCATREGMAASSVAFATETHASAVVHEHFRLGPCLCVLHLFAEESQHDDRGDIGHDRARHCAGD